MYRGFAPTIGLLLALAPVTAHAQTNIDEGKSPAQMFASDCAVCHKAPRGLANGRNSLALSGFLVQHYTSSREQAAALAAYVLGAGGNESGTAAQGRGQKPGQEHARTPSEEPRPPIRQARQPAKPEEEAPTSARPRRPAEEEGKSEEENGAVAEPGAGRRPAAGHEGRATATRGRRKEPETAPHEPTAIVAAPSVPEMPGGAAPSTTAPVAAAPAGPQPEAGSSVPRDDIPD